MFSFSLISDWILCPLNISVSDISHHEKSDQPDRYQYDYKRI